MEDLPRNFLNKADAGLPYENYNYTCFYADTFNILYSMCILRLQNQIGVIGGHSCSGN